MNFYNYIKLKYREATVAMTVGVTLSQQLSKGEKLFAKMSVAAYKV
jgi:hypothetical protein